MRVEAFLISKVLFHKFQSDFFGELLHRTSSQQFNEIW